MLPPFPILPPSTAPIGPGILDAAAAVNLAPDNDRGNPTRVLNNGVPLGNLYDADGDAMLFSIDVPAGARNLSLRSFGGMGDVSMYVSRGHAPTADNHDHASTRIGNNERWSSPRHRSPRTTYSSPSRPLQGSQRTGQLSYTPPASP
jgi:serine protease